MLELCIPLWRGQEIVKFPVKTEPYAEANHCSYYRRRNTGQSLPCRQGYRRMAIRDPNSQSQLDETTRVWDPIRQCGVGAIYIFGGLIMMCAPAVPGNISHGALSLGLVDRPVDSDVGKGA